MGDPSIEDCLALVDRIRESNRRLHKLGNRLVMLNVQDQSNKKDLVRVVGSPVRHPDRVIKMSPSVAKALGKTKERRKRSAKKCVGRDHVRRKADACEKKVKKKDKKCRSRKGALLGASKRKTNFHVSNGGRYVYIL